MRNQQPDNFFREKLADYHKPAPAGAWDRIESSLKKTENKFDWWKVAASILLLSAITYVIWLQSSTATKQPIAQVKEEVESRSLKSADASVDASEKSLTGEEKVAEQVPATIPAENKNASDKKTRSKTVSRRKNEKQKVAALNETVTAEELQSSGTSSAETVSDEVVPAIQPAKKSSSVTIIITAEETDKYLDKNALAEATLKERKSSTFKKLLMKANELTNNQDPFGDLRVKKNEILALEFKNDKRGQN